VALRYVTEAVQELDQAILDPPDNHDYRDNLRTLLNVLEPVARSHGQRDVACDLAGRRASEFRNEHRREPTSSTRTKLSDALDRSARNALDVEASEAAVAAASEAVELDRDALAEDPDDPNLVWRLCTAERLLVRAHEATGHRATADALRDVVLDRARGLVQLDSSVRNLRLLSREIRSGMHDLDDAETLARMVELADVLARIAAETKTDADVTDAAECLGDLAEIHWENGLHDAAYDTLGRARALLIRPVTTPENVDLQVAALRMRSQQADVRFDQERDGEALALTAETLSALDQLIDDDGPSEMLTELVGTQLRRRVRTARRRGANDALLDVMREWTERTSAYARQTSSVELRLLSVQAREETARALRDHHRHIESWPIFEAALADIRQLADEHPDDAQIAAMLDVFEHPDDAFND
jgi:tetratricopeptide (TPR) repeat protein